MHGANVQLQYYHAVIFNTEVVIYTIAWAVAFIIIFKLPKLQLRMP